MTRSSEAGLSAADAVFNAISSQIRLLDLAPGAKISEVEIARQFGISRQPVRDAFRQLSKLGFLVIRPQRPTEVSLISPSAILAARFMRTSVEVEMVRLAISFATPQNLHDLESLLDAQREAVAMVDADRFRHLDDSFHFEICKICGLGDVWSNIAESKAHTDRLRLLSIRDSSADALKDHEMIFEAMKQRDVDLARGRMREHLGRIEGVLDDLMNTHGHWFSNEDST